MFGIDLAAGSLWIELMVGLMELGSTRLGADRHVHTMIGYSNLKFEKSIGGRWGTCGPFLSLALPSHFHIWLILMSCWASLTIPLSFARASYSVWIDASHINLTLMAIRFNQLSVNSVLTLVCPPLPRWPTIDFSRVSYLLDCLKYIWLWLT